MPACLPASFSTIFVEGANQDLDVIGAKKRGQGEREKRIAESGFDPPTSGL